DTLLLKRKTELMAGRVPIRQSLTLTVNELLNSYIMQIEHPATQKRYRLSQRALSPHYGACRIDKVDALTLEDTVTVAVAVAVNA
ncbi:MAG: hypothetical protein LAO18_24080, partial [Acidobacteriia bacterium]|nr:hypothetical protein [Terriglobia bacterium]